ncbi:hypothetical protein QTO34_002615, partial [Cnephaeus nilssonii]
MKQSKQENLDIDVKYLISIDRRGGPSVAKETSNFLKHSSFLLKIQFLALPSVWDLSCESINYIFASDSTRSELKPK